MIDVLPPRWKIASKIFPLFGIVPVVAVAWIKWYDVQFSPNGLLVGGTLLCAVGGLLAWRYTLAINRFLMSDPNV